MGEEKKYHIAITRGSYDWGYSIKAQCNEKGFLLELLPNYGTIPQLISSLEKAVKSLQDFPIRARSKERARCKKE